MAKPKILIVEDSAALATTFKQFLRALDVDCDIAETGGEALSRIEAEHYDCLVLDVNLPDMSGLDIMEHVKEKNLSCEVVVVTGNASMSLAVNVMRMGAFDFVVKPLNAERLCVTVKNALERHDMAKTITTIKQTFDEGQVGGFIGKSLPMQAVYRILKSAAPSNATVFITGESGTGKEVCADALHRLSRRASGPFITINAAAIPHDLLESEIFGHVKGAFSGATADRKGAALSADGGTLFIDEICEMDINLQAKLLRFLQSKQVQRLGEDKVRSSDVRVVCATNRNPVEEVQAGRFREDLFYRLHVIPVELPPLRERGSDVLEIANHFLKQFSAEDGKQFSRFSEDAGAILVSHQWPGNVRQLQNVVRSVVVLNDGEEITPEMLPLDMLGSLKSALGEEPQSAMPNLTEPLHDILARARLAPVQPKAAREIRPLEEVIRETIENAVEAFDGSVPRAAAALEVSPSTLYRRMESWKTEEAV